MLVAWDCISAEKGQLKVPAAFFLSKLVHAFVFFRRPFAPLMLNFPLVLT